MTTDGTGLLSASWDSSCRLWRVEAGETFACKCRYALDNYGAAAEFFLLDVQMISTGNVRGWGCAQRRFSRASPARTRRTWW